MTVVQRDRKQGEINNIFHFLMKSEKKKSLKGIWVIKLCLLVLAMQCSHFDFLEKAKINILRQGQKEEGY